jgi:hypothetical protein
MTTANGNAQEIHTMGNITQITTNSPILSSPSLGSDFSLSDYTEKVMKSTSGEIQSCFPHPHPTVYGPIGPIDPTFGPLPSLPGVKLETIVTGVLKKDAAPEKKPAHEFLDEAAAVMKQRAALRDKEGGERTAGQIAKVFNAITGHEITEADAWIFLITLKIVRSRNGKYNEDDYTDLSAYAALLGEHESESRQR